MLLKETVAVKKFALLTLAVFACLAPAASASAAESKPVVVVTFSGYDQLKADLDFIGQISDNPELGNSLEGLVALLTQLQGLVGLDKSKPWGLAISTDGLDLQNIAFLPVNDLKKLLGVLVGIVGPPEDKGEHVQIRVNGAPVFIKSEKGWAFLAMDPEHLANLPKDPQAIFGTLTKDYDLAVRVNVQNVPEPYRDRAISEIKRGMQQGLERKDDETDAQYQTRVNIMETQVEQLTQLIKDLDALTLGWAIDGKARRAILDFSLTAIAGSQMAKQSVVEIIPSRFAGFLSPDTLFNAHCATKQKAADVTQSVAMLNSLRSSIADAITNDDDLPTDQEKETVKKLATQLLDVIEATLKQGVIDGGLLVTPTAPFTIAGGLGVVGGDTLESAFKQAVDLGKKKADAPKAAFDVAKYQSVNFHTLKGPWPENDDADAEDIENMKAALGDELELTAGFSKDAIYFALGPDGVGAIKKVIDGSAGAAKADLPLQMNLAMGRVLDFLAEQDPDNPVLGICADTLEKGKDKIHLTSRMVPNGSMMRIEIEEGVLRVLGVGARAAQGAMGPR
jgi:hypothetical protein